MKRTIAVGLAIVVLLAGLPAGADDHLVSVSAMQARLTQAGAQRQADLAAVRSLLVSPAGVSAAARVGLDADALSERGAVLSDEELRDLAQRAELLRTDPVAGGIVKILLIIGIVIVVCLVLLAAQCASETGCNIV
jgi:hypothetical protein